MKGACASTGAGRLPTPCAGSKQACETGADGAVLLERAASAKALWCETEQACRHYLGLNGDLADRVTWARRDKHQCRARGTWATRLKRGLLVLGLSLVSLAQGARPCALSMRRRKSAAINVPAISGNCSLPRWRAIGTSTVTTK
jgi:hypothetical protein